MAIESPEELTPDECIKLFVPSCTTSNSAVSNLVLAVLFIETIYLALLNVAVAKLSSTEAEELATVTVPEVSCVCVAKVIVPDTVALPVTPRVEPLKLKLPSAVMAEVPVPVKTALSVRLDAPVPPSATGTSVPPAL